MGAQKVAIMASIFMGLVVVIVVTNLLMSLRGSARTTMSSLPLRFVWVGVIFYLLVSLQGSFQAAMPVQEQLHFSDWVIGHSHLAMAGFATFSVIGGLLQLWPRVAGRPVHARYANLAFWVGSVALITMVTDLSMAGLQQASAWASGAPWIDSVTASSAAWLTRTISGMFLAAAFVLLLMSLLRRPGVGDTALAQEDSPEQVPASAMVEVNR
jgi:cytochrome c oxidase cbb3-type subunit 1